MADLITYHYSSIQQSIQDIHGVVNNINTEIDDLAATAKKAMAGWTMQGSDVYQQDVQKIQSDLDSLDSTLTAFAIAMGDSAQQFTDLDNKVAQSFQ